MAFTGSATVTKITDYLVRITGLSLAAGADGTISLFDGAGTVKLPDSCNWGPNGDVDLAEAIQFSSNPVTDVSNYAIPIRAVKTGTVPTNWLLTLTNDSAATASADLEMYIRFH
jgi:hypothetical protein